MYDVPIVETEYCTHGSKQPKKTIFFSAEIYNC